MTTVTAAKHFQNKFFLVLIEAIIISLDFPKVEFCL